MFLGKICLPPTAKNEDEKKIINEMAQAEASSFQEDPTTFWTDGSAFDGGACVAAVVWFRPHKQEG